MPPDLYTELLDIPEGTRPPDCYTLLGLPLYENAPEAIRKAVLSQTAKVRRHALDPDRERAQRIQEILNEIGRARTILGDPQRKSRHDELMIARQFGFETPSESGGAPTSGPHRLCPDCGAQMTAEQRMCTRCGWKQAEAGSARGKTQPGADEQAAGRDDARASWSETIPGDAGHPPLRPKSRLWARTVNSIQRHRGAAAAAVLALVVVGVAVLVREGSLQRAGTRQQKRVYEQALLDARGAMEQEDWDSASALLHTARDCGWRDTAAAQQVEHELQQAKANAARRSEYEKSIAAAQQHKAERRWDLVVTATERAIATGWPDTATARTLEAEARKHVGSPGSEITVALGGGVTMQFCWVPATTSRGWKAMSGGKDFFVMGSPVSELKRSTREVQHAVKITRGFWMGKYEITQEQWQYVMGANPSRTRGAMRPVEMVAWSDCQKFVSQLNQLGIMGVFRLPSEAEWEYACRAGTRTMLNSGRDVTDMKRGGPNLAEVGWFWKSRPEATGTHLVGQKKPNAWGLYDMHGNVFEWCQDWHGFYPQGNVTDPTGPALGEKRALRGGSWVSGADKARSAYRGERPPEFQNGDTGLRVVLVR